MKEYFIVLILVSVLISGCSSKPENISDIVNEEKVDLLEQEEIVETDPVNQEQPTAIYVCKPNLDVFYVTPNSGFFKKQNVVTVWDVEKKNSENIYSLFEYPNGVVDSFLVWYRKQTGFPGSAKIEVLKYTDNHDRTRTLLDIGLEEQIRYTNINNTLVVVKDMLMAKGCEGPNCIKTEEFIDLLVCDNN